MEPIWYDRQGRPMDWETAGRCLADKEYRRVGSTTVGPYWVSTVWLGIDHGFSPDGPPIIFETMVFLAETGDTDLDAHLGADVDLQRYATEEQARQGHEDMVTLIRAIISDELTEGGSIDMHNYDVQPEGGSD